MDTVPDDHKVWVGGLPKEASSEDLQNHFQQLGEPVDCQIISLGIGCIAYSSADEADMAASAYNGSDVGGAAIKTEKWDTKMASKGKGKGKGGNSWEGKSNGGYNGGYNNGGKSGGKGNYGGGGAAVSFPASTKGRSKGGGGGGSSWSAPRAGGPPVHCVSVPEKSTIPQQGFPNTAPVMVYEKGIDIFSSARNLMSDIAGSEQIDLTHDDEWTVFPELGQALVQATGEEHCFAIACLPAWGVWGVGCGSGWKGREAAAKAALALAIAGEDPSMVARAGNHYPEFIRLCQSQGIPVGAATQKQQSWGNTQMQNWGGEQDSWGGGAKKAKNNDWAAPVAMGSGVPPLTVITLPAESEIVQKELPAEGPAIAHDKSVKEHFSNTWNILAEFVQDQNSEITYYDDPDWHVFPEIAAAIKAAGLEDNCYMVAVHEQMRVWGLGLAGGAKNRKTAANMSLAAVIAYGSGRADELAATYPEFGEILATAGWVTQMPAKKKQRAW